MKWVKFEDYQRIPIKSWCGNDIEVEALKQAINLSQLPFAFKHIALMPDCHVGYGMPIGGVMATNIDIIIPNCVGVDISCGMQATRTSLNDIDTDTLKKIMSDVRDCIPVGFKHHGDCQQSYIFDNAPDIPIIQQELQSARHQLGTLGGGNHFIEFQSGDDGYIWIMVHSGSRNIGYKIANEYHKKAKVLCEKWFSNIPNTDLSFLPMDSKEGEEYFEAMGFAMSFALASRSLMINYIRGVFSAYTNCGFSEDHRYDIHHNYAVRENHFGKNVMVHRKGAIRARKDDVGIVPGSQGTASYIVRGLGNPDSFMSCSHGAGRIMGRKQACRELDFDEEVCKLNDRGIIHSIREVKDLDEASGAYKNIDEVMKAQSDLVEIVVKLTPLAVIKG